MAFFTDKGIYDNGTPYSRNDIVEYNSNSYVCQVDSTGNNPDDAKYWVIINTFAGVYNPGTTYNIDDSVEYNEKIYICYNGNPINILPTNTDNWDLRFIGANLSTFNEPNHIVDDFIEHIDPQASDAIDITRYQTLRIKANRTPSEEAELMSLIQALRDKILTADDFNKYQDSLQSMQIFIKNNVEGYIKTKQTEFDNQILNFETIGVYDNSIQYYERNMVSYGDSFYIAKQNTKGNVPSNTTCWQKITTNGDSGILGVLVGAWDSGTTYAKNEGVIYNNEFYISLDDDNTGNTPLKTSNPNWVYVYMDVSLLQDKSISIAKQSTEVNFNAVFNGLIGMIGNKYKTSFDTPNAGDITEEIRNISTGNLLASKITQFDTPSMGQIQEDITIVETGLILRKNTIFNIDDTISEYITEVII